MPMVAVCPHCTQQYRVKEELAGKGVKCKKCGGAFRVPVPVAVMTELSEAGAEVHRYGDRQREFEPAIGSDETVEAVSAHIEKYIGPIETVYHELISDVVHVDVYWVKPTEERPWHTFVTSGMSDRPMAAPEGAEEYQYGELMIRLPPEWPVGDEDFKIKRNYWPIQWLKILARFPHEYDSWICYGHTIPNGDPPEPFAENTKLCCCMLMPPEWLPEEAQTIREADKSIVLYDVAPIYREEMDLKLKKGIEALAEKMGDLLDSPLKVDRPNGCKKRFGLF
jgi:predicted Zn finger-like uncharacterized protein